MPNDHSGNWPDDRIRDEFEKLHELPEQVATLSAEVTALRQSLAEAHQRSQRVTTAILAFVVPITLALITGGVEIVLHITSQTPAR